MGFEILRVIDWGWQREKLKLMVRPKARPKGF
jgi:hypothetical protein